MQYLLTSYTCLIAIVLTSEKLLLLLCAPLKLVHEVANLDSTDLYGSLDLSYGTYPSAAVPPQFSVATDTATPTEGEQFMLTLSLVPPIPTVDITLTKIGVPITDTRFSVAATNLTIADVTRDDSGVYQITASNVAGSDTFTLTVNVYCECMGTWIA